MNLLQELTDKGLMTPPDFVVVNCQYLTKMGSSVYGCATEDSDVDVYGFFLPPLDMMFPHLSGEIHGFGRQINRFGVFQQHHIIDGYKNYDISVYSLPKYFQLLKENNPNMSDSINTSEEEVLYHTKISKMVRDNRQMFFHKGAYYKYSGYAFSQLSKIKNKNGHENPKRNADIQSFGYDLKYSYHCLRLMREIQDILLDGECDLKRHKDLLMSIRRGEYTLEQFEVLFNEEDAKMKLAFDKSVLPECPDEQKIKQLLLDCIEEFYGKLDFFKI